ncbi:MAG: hypothetical protein H7843_00090 [Nitrospirota bacterium]
MFIARKTLFLVSFVIIVTATVSVILASFYFAAEEKEAVGFWMNEASKYYKEMMRLREQLAKYDKKFADNLTKERRMASTNFKTANANNQGEFQQQASGTQASGTYTQDKETKSNDLGFAGIIVLGFFAVSIVILYVLSSKKKDK